MRPSLLRCLLYPVCFLLAACQAPESTSASKTDWLIAVKTTRQISSNHYADFVLDENGHAYLASFHQVPEGNNYLLICQIKSDGSKGWEHSGRNAGRATTISLDPAGKLWVGGFFDKHIRFGQHEAAAEGRSPFLAQFDRDGRCLQLITGEGSGIFYSSRINLRGELLLYGQGSRALRFGKQAMQNDSLPGESFLACFDMAGNCRWLQAMEGEVNQISSDKQGDFYLAGSFREQFFLAGHALRTRDQWDNDGFVSKLSPTGELRWLQQLGQHGHTRYGYRSGEGAGALWYDPQRGELLVALRLQQGKTADTEQAPMNLCFARYRPGGSRIALDTLARGIAPDIALTLSADTAGRRYLGFAIRDTVQIGADRYPPAESGQRAMLLVLDAQTAVQEVIAPRTAQNTLFRMSKTFGNQVYLSGHVQHQIAIEDLRLQSEGEHTLFLWKTQRE